MLLSVREDDFVVDRKVRDEFMNRTDILNKVKGLSLLPNNIHVTTKDVADYYEVKKTVIDQLVQRHKDELSTDELITLSGEELRSFKQAYLQDVSTHKFTSQLTLFPKRAVLRVGMLLRDSEIAKKIRSYLLNVEKESTEMQKGQAIEKITLHTEIDSGLHEPTDTPKTFLDALKLCVKLEEKRIEVESKLEVAQPKADQFDRFMNANNCLTIDQVAKTIGWGQKKLFKFLRGMNVLTKNNIPRQFYVDQGYFNVRIIPIIREGEVFNHTQPVATSKGYIYIRDLISKHNVYYLQD